MTGDAGDDAAAGPGNLPWHAVNPDSWSLLAAQQESRRRSGPSVATNDRQNEREPFPSLDDPPLAEQFTLEEDTSTPAAIDVGSTKPMARSGAHFNSPWAIEEKPPRSMQDEEIQSSRRFELYKLQAVNFELNVGDTLVFVDYPSASSRHAAGLDCYGTAYASRQFRVHSEKLLATGSTVFKDLLGPSRQFRVLRRRKLVNKLPEGIKFVIDLTPPQEGEDLVAQLSTLSLTPGITKWWLADKLHGVDTYLVNGHDDVCSCMREKLGTSVIETDASSPTTGENGPDAVMQRLMRQRHKDPPTSTKLIQLQVTGEKLDHEIPQYRKIPDYCPFRHCNSIVRLLMLIEGHNLVLDSASRVWTLLGIAKILDCPMILRDKVTQWLMYGVNTRFIEVLPEEALTIGFALELPEITQCAFRILVNELALELSASPGTAIRRDSGATLFGRKRGDAGDEVENLIQHSSRALCERVEITMKLLEGDVYDNFDVAEWQRLLELEASLAENDHEIAILALVKLRELKLILNRDFKNSLMRISSGLQHHHEAAYTSIDSDRASYAEPEDFDRLSTVLAGLNKTQLRLCAFFYHDLMYLCDGLLSIQNQGDIKRGPGAHAGDLVSELQDLLQALEQDQHGLLPISITGTHPVGCERFMPVHLHTLRHQLDNAVKPVAHWWHRHRIDPPLNITRHLLLTLSNNELKYLPLWAGGNNDGTGGVFESLVPSSDMGPSGPGPSYHTGMTIPSATSSVSGSLMEEIRNMNVMGSTTAGSIDVHDSISTVYRPDKVIADDKSIATESFTASDGPVYSEARYFEPADHQPTGKAIEMLVDGGSTDRGSVADSGASEKEVNNMTAEDWEIDDGSGSDTASDSSMVMV